MSAFTLLLLALAGAAARTFVDDAGVTHTTTKSYPTIITVVADGLSLVQFGLRHEQLKATIGERATSGSNVNGVYADGNANDHGAHASADYDPRHFPADPTAAELSVLAHAVDLSPSCSGGNFWCAAIDIESALLPLEWPTPASAPELLPSRLTALLCDCAVQNSIRLVHRISLSRAHTAPTTRSRTRRPRESRATLRLWARLSLRSTTTTPPPACDAA